MKTTQLIPFERNRYYYGKMLTSPDFQEEQQYFRNKQMLLNQMTLGGGIVCGLNVFNLDDFSILVESGIAVDSLGREIIVEKSAVKKISALEGFHEEGEGHYCLCLKYREEEIKPVYAVNRKENQPEYENNRIVEGYQLFLVEARTISKRFSLDSEFFVETQLRKDADFTLKLRLPACACRGRNIKVSLIVEKISDKAKELNVNYVLQLPSFSTKDGGHELEINEEHIQMEKGTVKFLDYWVKTGGEKLDETSILIRSENKKEQELKLILTDEEPEHLIRRSLGKTSLEIREAEEEFEFVRLADLYMTKVKADWILDRIEEQSVKNYLSLPIFESKKQEYLSYYDNREPDRYLPEKEDITSSELKPEKREEDYFSQNEADIKEPGIGSHGFLVPPVRNEVEDLWIAGGTLEIPLEQKMKKGAVCFSEEISHGLGPGSVYVSLGLDEPKDGAHVKKKIISTIYGDSSLFSAKNPLMTCVETGVQVWEERGSFQAAVRILGEQNTVLLSFHWIAVRIPELNETALSEQMQPMRISPENATVNLKPKEKYFFAVRFHQMEPSRLRYELTEEDSGRVGEDGTYTAPLKSGVYEIKISCWDYPEICTYAYAVVSAK